MSTLHNHSTADIADLIGALDSEIKALEIRIKTAKAELADRGIIKAEGLRYTVTKVESVRWNLDLAAAKTTLGEAWCLANSKLAAVVSWRIGVNRAALTTIGD
jgi:hypothetical protein